MLVISEGGKQVLSLLSIAMSMVGFGVYYVTILRGTTRPHIFTWILWSLLQFIGFFAQLQSGAGAGAWPTGTSGLLCFIALLLALRRGERNITRSDWCAFAGALAAIPVWLITSDPLNAIIIVTAIDALAFYPTLRKTYVNPFEEDYRLYAIDCVRWIPALLALDAVTVATALFQGYIMLADGVIVAMILLRRRNLSRKA